MSERRYEAHNKNALGAWCVYEDPKPVHRRGGIMCDDQEQAELVANALNSYAQVAALTEQRDAAVAERNAAIAACREALPILRHWDNDGTLATAMVEHVCARADEMGIDTTAHHVAAAIAMTEGAKGGEINEADRRKASVTRDANGWNVIWEDSCERLAWFPGEKAARDYAAALNTTFTIGGNQ